MDQAEQLRNIIKNSNQSQHKPMARVITVTSGKGGVGKSNLSVNLAIQLKKLGKRVVILDADFGLANVEIMLGIRPQYTLADLMFKEKPLKNIITEGPEKIGFISGGSGIQELSNLTKEQVIYLTQKLGELDEITDIIIVDTGAGITDAVLEFVAMSNEILLVVTPEPTSITDAYSLLKALNKKAEYDADNTVVRMVANRVLSIEEGRKLYEKLNIVVNKFLNIQMKYLGAIPQDNQVVKAVMQQKPFSIAFPNSSAAKAVLNLAKKLNDGEDGRSSKNGIANLFAGLIHFKLKK